MKKYIQRFDQFSKVACSVSMTKRIFAWVQEVVMAGDEIYSFEFCRIPFVLREEKNSHRLMGNCYLHVLMKSETFCLLNKVAKPDHNRLN